MKAYKIDIKYKLKVISSNIDISQYISDDFLVDYEKDEEKCQLNESK